MRVREAFVVRPRDGQAVEVDLPIAIDLGDDRHAELSTDEVVGMRLVLDRAVDPLALSVETVTTYYETPDGLRLGEMPVVRAPGNGNVSAMDVTAALTFLTDVAFLVSPVVDPPEWIAEDEVDVATLRTLETKHPHREMTARVCVRTFNPVVDGNAVVALIPKAVGLRLYADAIALTTDVAKFRELWRVLESAFRLQDAKLVAVLVEYPPAQELGFDRSELSRLHVFRGRVSHAATTGGLAELLKAGDEASQHIDRLKCLVERVILTKRTWGARSGGVHEITPLTGFTDASGTATIQTFQPSESEPQAAPGRPLTSVRASR